MADIEELFDEGTQPLIDIAGLSSHAWEIIASDEKSSNNDSSAEKTRGSTPESTLSEKKSPDGSATSEYTPDVQPLHVMLASFIGSIGIVFGVVPIIIPYDHFEVLRLDIVPYIGRTLCSIVLLTLSSFFIFWRLCNCSKAVQVNEVTAASCAEASWTTMKNFASFVAYRCPALIQILVFASGSIATCALDIYNHSKDDSLCMSVFLLGDTTRILCLASQMVLYSWFLYDRPKVLPTGYYGLIALMIGAQVWLWISDTTEPFWTMGRDYEDSCIAANTTKPDDGNELIEGLGHFLEPFHIDFSTISIGLLYELWSFVPDKKYHNKDLQNPSLSISKTHKIILVLLFCLYVSVSSLIQLSPCPRCEENKFAVFVRVMVYRGIFYLLFGVGLLYITAKALLKLNSNDKSYSTTNTSLGQYLLIITSIFMYVYYIVRIFAAAYDLHRDYTHGINGSLASGNEFLKTYRSATLRKHVFSVPNITRAEVLGLDGFMLTYPFFIIAQVWIQSQLLIEAQRHKEIPDFVKKVFLYIIMLNLAEWLKTGIALGFDRDGGQLVVNPIMNTFFSDQGARIIRLCIYPFMILYRFHSAVVAWEILVVSGSDNGKTDGHDQNNNTDKQDPDKADTIIMRGKYERRGSGIEEEGQMERGKTEGQHQGHRDFIPGEGTADIIVHETC